MPKHRISELLKPDAQRHSALKRLLNLADEQREATATLRALLPTTLANECRVTQYRARRLHVRCANAATATRLRFMRMNLVRELRRLSRYASLEDIQIAVSPLDIDHET